MLHRVLPAELRDCWSADPTYTVTPELLRSALTFLHRYYRFVSVDDLLASRARRTPLPASPLLVTFDDGWKDNLDYAQPVLEDLGVPWIVFAATEAVSAPSDWWHEPLEWAVRTGRADLDNLWNIAWDGRPDHGEAPKTILDLAARFASLDPGRRQNALNSFIGELRVIAGERWMLDRADLRQLRSAGVAVGVHGASHLPLTQVANADADLLAAREWLIGNVDEASGRTLSFPHGRYDANIVRIARDMGFQLMFTSDPVLNPCPGGWLTSDVLGRISLTAKAVEGAAGMASGERLATWLMLRERAQHHS